MLALTSPGRRRRQVHRGRLLLLLLLAGIGTLGVSSETAQFRQRLAGCDHLAFLHQDLTDLIALDIEIHDCFGSGHHQAGETIRKMRNKHAPPS